ncbi:hypothetical protein ACS0TY_017618 [Phlomoides rotata]
MSDDRMNYAWREATGRSGGVISIWNSKNQSAYICIIGNFNSICRSLEWDDRDLKEWNRQVFGNLDEAIKRHKQDIQELDLIDDVRRNWIKEGDLNSHILHNFIKIRCMINEIVGREVNGEWREEVTEVKQRLGWATGLAILGGEFSRPKGSLGEELDGRWVREEIFWFGAVPVSMIPLIFEFNLNWCRVFMIWWWKIY